MNTMLIMHYSRIDYKYYYFINVFIKIHLIQYKLHYKISYSYIYIILEFLISHSFAFSMCMLIFHYTLIFKFTSE